MYGTTGCIKRVKENKSPEKAGENGGKNLMFSELHASLNLNLLECFSYKVTCISFLLLNNFIFK